MDLGEAQPEGSELVGQYVGAKFLIPARWEEEATELSPGDDGGRAGICPADLKGVGSFETKSNRRERAKIS